MAPNGLPCTATDNNNSSAADSSSTSMRVRATVQLPGGEERLVVPVEPGMTVS